MNWVAKTSSGLTPTECVEAEIRWVMWDKRVHKAWWVLAGILLAVLPSAAQLQVGDKWQMNLGGDIGYTYNGNLNQGVSAHSMGLPAMPICAAVTTIQISLISVSSLTTIARNRTRFSAHFPTVRA